MGSNREKSNKIAVAVLEKLLFLKGNKNLLFRILMVAIIFSPTKNAEDKFRHWILYHSKSPEVSIYSSSSSVFKFK